MNFLIITGLSGAGKSRAADVLEDLDYYCVDNMPVALMPRFAELCLATRGRYEKVALVTDVRERDGFNELLGMLDELRGMDLNCQILYMTADRRTLIRRYKESRRPHPLSARGVSVEEAVQKEEELLAPVRERADFIVDTSSYTLGMLQHKIFSLFAGEGEQREIDITVMSFGYKHGIPMEADLVFDARFLPNPYYVERLQPMSGMDLPVAEFVFGYQQARSFLEKLEDMMAFLLPLYIEEGKLSLTLAIGCTGGRHRSVALASALNDHFVASGLRSVLVNRDIDK
ncbi:MAG: RNase adapter RapZ [Oscillospiraceae bacterium]|nr:RNase adapter RapZ [Oscillospiraceae bacterium]